MRMEAEFKAKMEERLKLREELAKVVRSTQQETERN